MEFVRWAARPQLRVPTLVAAFSGWNDAGDAATVAAAHLIDALGARTFATLDPEEFYDFTTQRPQVRLGEGFTREIVWPENRFAAAGVQGSRHDVIVLLGVEPQLRWRTFCDHVTGIARELGAGMVITLGALLADVPHTRPVRIIGTATDAGLIEQFSLQRSRYEGPTGIVGTLHDACTRAGVGSMSLWAAVPAYVPNAPSPKAALALVEQVGRVLGVAVPVTSLQIASSAYEREVDAAVARDDDMRQYLERLEHAIDSGADLDDEDEDEDDELGGEPAGEAPSAEQLVEEVERFLRDQSKE